MSKHWNKVKWRTQIPIEKGPSESTLLKLNCDKALHYLGWEATWDFETTVRETVDWYKHFYEASHVDVKAISEFQIKSFVKLLRKELEMVEIGLESIKVTSLKRLESHVLHAMKRDDEGYKGFGEVYFSTVITCCESMEKTP